MTDHRRARALAAAAIDFELTAQERAELDAHLGSCPACRVTAAQVRQQARALADRPRVAPPARMRRFADAGTVSGWTRRPSFSGRLLAITGAVAIIAVTTIAVGLPRLAVYLGQIGTTPTRAPGPTSEAGQVQTFTGLAGAHSITATSSHCLVLPASDCVTDVQTALGSVWITTSDSILRFDPISETVVANIPVGSFPHRIWYAAASLWTTVVNPGALVRVDPGTNTVITSIPIGGSPAGLVDGGDSIWVVDAQGDRVVRVDPSTNTVIGETPLAFHPWGITATDGAIWVADTGAGRIVRIDPGSGAVAATIQIPGAETDASDADLAGGFGRVWLTGHGGIYVYDTASGRLDSLLSQAYPRIAIAPDAVWVVGNWNALIQEFDPTTLTQIGQSILYAAGGTSAAFEVSIDVAPDGTLWAATDEGNRLFKITPTP
jgi:streptogramin lyase